MTRPIHDECSNGQRVSSAAAADAAVTLLIGNGRPGTALLYELLCLHPQVAFFSHLESRWPWLPVTLTGRLRLRRYSSKLRYWFREHESVSRGRRALARRLRPAGGEAVYARCGLAVSSASQDPPERAAHRLRMRLERLQESTGAGLVVCGCGPADAYLPALTAILPHASGLEVVRDPHGAGRLPAYGNGTGGPAPRRGPLRCGPARLHTVRYEALVTEPVEQMRQVLAFLGLERRLDYEWALKTLKLDRAAAAPPARVPAATTALRARQVAGRDLSDRDSLAPPGYAS